MSSPATQRERAIVKPERKGIAHFLHIGKTGGSAVKHALRDHLSDGAYRIRLHRHKVKLRDVPRGEKVFFFLRDPVARVVSGFYSRMRQGRPRIFSAWSPDEEIAFRRFRTPNQMAVALSSADREQRERARHAMRSIVHVRDSYWKWFESEEYLRSRQSDILWIGWQQNLSQDFEVLKERLSLPDGVRLPDDDVRSHRNPSGVDKKLDTEAESNLRGWCQGEYAFISLSNEIIEEEGCGGALR